MQFIKRSNKGSNNTVLCISDTHTSNIRVFEVGYNTPPSNYFPTHFPNNNAYTLHYVVHGKLNYNGQTLCAPCVFLITPTSPKYSTPPNDGSPRLEQYWIQFNGENIETILSELGLLNETLSSPCNYMDKAVSVFEELQNINNYSDKSDGYYMISGLFNLFALHSAQSRYVSNMVLSPLVDSICVYIRNNYASITHEEQIANAVHVSVSHMHKRFKSEMGITPLEFLQREKIKNAKHLLKNTNISISEISASVGFSNPNYFCLVFKKHYDGLSPSAYRKNLQTTKNTEK